MTIDENNLIRLHGKAGGTLVFEFQDENGNPRVMTGRTIKFQTQTYSKNLTVGNTTDKMVLTLIGSQLPASHLGKQTPFIITDETDAAAPVLILEGKLMVFGWM